MKTLNQTAYINLSLIISVMAPMVINIVSPAIPFLMSYFLNSTLVNYVIPVAILGLLAGQIIAGLISINISKNTVIRAGLYAFILSSLICFLTSNIIIFLIGRFLQGVCASIIGVNNRALVREKFDGNTYGVVIGYVMLCWNIFVMVMPLIGGGIQILFGWKSIFLFNILLAIIILYANKLIVSPSSFRYQLRRKNKPFFVFFLNARFISNTLALGLITASGVIFVQFAPLFMHNNYRTNPFNIGFLTSFVGLSYIISNIIGTYALRSNRLSLGKHISSLCVCTGIIILVFFLNQGSISSFIIPTILIQLGFGIRSPIIAITTLKKYKFYASAATAAQGLMLWLASAVVSTTFGYTNNSNLKVYIFFVGTIFFIITLIEIFQKHILTAK
ncbi:MAG: hypothetical protein K0R94_74 [Burkholderiales bacterium]|jgi:DHA1 family bicyclomycin/chloramphenicol resistance-like MFS transporter|nr:hypothetical protein [Burkholderiales bacterium]